MSDYAEPGVITELPAPTPKDLQIGVDIGGTGIKGGIVDLRTGNLVSDRFRIDTPKPATPAAVAEVVRRVVDELQGRDLAPDPESAVGIDFPAVVKNGMVFSAANVDDSWINTDLEQVMSEALDGRTVYGLNDADAAGLAEATYGQGRNRDGLIAVITLGTGIGSALINGKRLYRYFEHVQMLFSPDLFIIGGGISKNPEKFMPYFEDQIRTPMVMAALRNNAGIVGAALWAGGMLQERKRRGEA